MPFRALGRRVHFVFTRMDSCVVQFARNNVARSGEHPVAHRARHVRGIAQASASRHGGSRSRRLEPRRDQYPRDPSWAPGVCVNFRRAAVVPRAIPSVPGLAVRSAGAPPVRWAALPPFGADSAPPSQSLRYAQGHDARMQRAMEALLGSIPRDDAQVERARRITTLPLRMGGLGSTVWPEDEARSILGFVGGCIAHVAATPSRIDTTSHKPRVGRASVWVLVRAPGGHRDA